MSGLGRTYSVSLEGVRGRIVEVEADIGASLPAFILLGLPDTSLVESKERIRSAARNSRHPLPARKLTVNLLPAGVPKRGPGFDLAIVLAALQADGRVVDTGKTVFLGELSLDGRLRPMRGILPAVLAAVQQGHSTIVCPRANHREATLVPGATVLSYDTLEQVLFDLGSPAAAWTPLSELPAPAQPAAAEHRDFSEIIGQPEACRAGIIAAAGGHHLALVGPSGVGKTMLAERLPGILPPLEFSDALEVSALHSSSGVGFREEQFTVPPFEAPHHSTTSIALVGGGGADLRPGAASRAHRGVLFLDEACEFPRRCLDVLRQPLESGVIRLHRARGSVEYPAAFQLVLATNPCPCGNSGSLALDCRCTSVQRRRYFSRLSGPLLDRVDLRVRMRSVGTQLLAGGDPAPTTAEAAACVAAARQAARERLQDLGCTVNAAVPGDVLRGQLRLPGEATAGLDDLLGRGLVSVRGYDRTLRVAWTLADLDGADQPTRDHVAEATLFRDAEGGCFV